MRVHRNDGGGGYKNIDLFCYDSGVARQITEAGNQSGNRKADVLHCTVMNMVSCIIFLCGMPLSFRGDAAEYSAHVLNRMPTRVNRRGAFTIAILTGRPPRFLDIAILGSPCETFHYWEER